MVICDQDALEALTDSERVTAISFGEHFEKVVSKWLGVEMYETQKLIAGERRDWDTNRANKKVFV